MIANRGRIIIGLFLGAIMVFMGNMAYGGQTMDYAIGDLNGLQMSYSLEGAFSPYKDIRVEISGEGQGRITYLLYEEYVAKNEEQRKTITFRVDEKSLKELAKLYRDVDFLKVQVVDLNKDKIRVFDVGTTTLTYRYKDKERTLSYGFAENDPLRPLIDFYWQIANEHLPKIGNKLNEAK